MTLYNTIPPGRPIILHRGPCDGKEVTLRYNPAVQGWPTSMDIKCTKRDNDGNVIREFVANYKPDASRKWMHTGDSNIETGEPVKEPPPRQEQYCHVCHYALLENGLCSRCGSRPIPPNAVPIPGNSIREQVQGLLGFEPPRDNLIAVVDKDTGQVTHMTPFEHHLWLKNTGGTDGYRDESKDTVTPPSEPAD